MTDPGSDDGSVKDVAYEEFPAPIGKLLGLKLSNVANGQATVEFEASGRHANPMGTLHGGVLCDIADAAMGAAYRSSLDEGESFTTLELKINFLRPVWNATLRAQARIVRAGRVVGLVECDILDERGRMVARASSTCMTLRGDGATGR
ncbi:MAG: PaaI family thioesterase [Candidatus Binataceae bacterium]